MGCFCVDYGELLSIIEDYVTSSSFTRWIIVESDSLLVDKNLSSYGKDFSELECLAFNLFLVLIHL